MTPEGVELDFRIAPLGDRIGAFLLDVAFQLLLLTGVGLTMALLMDGGGSATVALLLFAIFVIQNLYFIVFEARTRGQTPGKRRIGIRVMDARGGPLTTDAVIVRNVMRTLEFWFPLGVLLSPGALFPGAPGWIILPAVIWILVVSGLPFLNRWHLRAGDLVGGTMVVVAPTAVLLGDLGGATLEEKAREEERLHFTNEQLDAYGIYELQVLEEVLRSEGGGLEQQRTLHAVAERIARRIDWHAAVKRASARTFLEQYYAALRHRLEQRMLFGKRKEDKHDVAQADEKRDAT